MTKIVSVQDISCFGSCSLTVALPVLAASGIETAILPSAILSTHTGGFSHIHVHDLTESMSEIVDCWIKEDLCFDGIYTGYIGDARQFDCIRTIRDHLLKENGRLIVDPAMADHGRLYSGLDESIVEGMKGLVKEADIILPNLTEAALLTGRAYKASYDKEEIHELLLELSELGPDLVVITGVSFEEGKIGAASYNRLSGEYDSYQTERIGAGYHGTGDLFASCLTADLMNGKSAAASIEDACEFVADCIRETMKDETHGYGVKFEPVLARRHQDEVMR